LLGTLEGEARDRAAQEGARTAPPRENGGNQDIKNLSRGSRTFMPVYVEGANLSVGDLHFSQGDGEITFCGAIEMGGYIDDVRLRYPALRCRTAARRPRKLRHDELSGSRAAGRTGRLSSASSRHAGNVAPLDK
jgi:hypothetical protein